MEPDVQTPEPVGDKQQHIDTQTSADRTEVLTLNLTVSSPDNFYPFLSSILFVHLLCVHVYMCVPWKSGEQVGGDSFLVHGGSRAQTQVVRVWQQVTLLTETSWWSDISFLMWLLTCPQHYLSWFLLTVANVKTSWQFSENRHRAIRLLSTNSLWRTGLLGCRREESLDFTFFLGMTSCSLTPATRLA